MKIRRRYSLRERLMRILRRMYSSIKISATKADAPEIRRTGELSIETCDSSPNRIPRTRLPPPPPRDSVNHRTRLFIPPPFRGRNRGDVRLRNSRSLTCTRTRRGEGGRTRARIRTHAGGDLRRDFTRGPYFVYISMDTV